MPGTLTRVARTVIALAALVGLLAPAEAGAQEGATLRVAARPISGATAGIPLPDPQALPAGPSAARDLVENLFVGLFRYDAATRQATPVLARDWSVSADGLTWTFRLREDIPWVSFNAQEGAIQALRPVVADDVVAALRRACHPLKPKPSSTAIFIIRGCYAAMQANPLLTTDEQVAALIGAEAPDPTTLVLHLTFPAAYLPGLLTAPEFRPIPREFAAFTAAWPMQASSGPYVLTGWTAGERLILERNPFWPDPLPGNINRVEIAYADDPGEVFAAGGADFVRLGAEAAPGASALRGDRVTILGFSTERAFVSAAGVRQALSWSIDRAALVADDPDHLAVTTFTHPGSIAGPEEAAAVGYAPEAARAALAAAGYPNCTNVPEVLKLGVPPGQESLAEQIIGMWSSVLGCQPGLFEVVRVRAATLRNIGRDLIDEEASDRIHLWLTDYTPEHLDAHGGAADAFHCTFGYFHSGLPCGAVDALIDWAATSVADPGERADVYTRIEARLFGPAGTLPAAPLFASAEYVGVAAGLTGAGSYGPAWWGAWTKT